MNMPSAPRFAARSVYASVASCICSLPLLASLCTGIAQTQPTQDNTWQYSVALEKGTERRAYRSKFLIISAGPDRTLGVLQLPTIALPTNQPPIAALPLNVANLIVEDAAIPVTTDPTGADPSSNPALDDISNHNLRAPGGPLQ